MYDDTTYEDEQCVLSYDLLQLLQWIIEHEQDALRRLIARSIKHGLGRELYQQAIADDESEEHSSEMQLSIVDFLQTMELLLQDTMHDLNAKNVLQRNMIPVVDQIDTTICDSNMVQHSLEKATTQVARDPSINPKDALLEELLRRWKPSKKIKSN